MEAIPVEFDIKLIGYLLGSFAIGLGIGTLWTKTIQFMEKI